MSETADGKIQSLLQQADSSTTADNSINQARRVFPTAVEAETAVVHFYEKIFRIEHWNDCSGVSSFELFRQKR